VEDGATVASGDAVAVLEAMKMESKIAAPRAGTIELQKVAGEFVTSGSVIACLS
jgi:acetyl-CoA/propionyl-CoA carboxylase biotin carboxyl carrier protein